MKSGGMYDAIMKYMEGGSLESSNQRGRVYKFGGKTYPHGGVHDPTDDGVHDPTGRGGSRKFRVIPVEGEGGVSNLTYYIDGEPVDSESFKSNYYEAGNKPENLQDLIRGSYKGQINAGSPTPIAREYEKSLEERDVYSKSGRPGIDSLYNARTDRFNELMRLRGGVEGRDY